MSKQALLYFKSFVIGSSFVMFFIPHVVYLLTHVVSPDNNYDVNEMAALFPLMVGLMNVIYFIVKDYCHIKSTEFRYWIVGCGWGLVLATIGTVIFKLPTEVFQLPEVYRPMVFVAAFFTYGLMSRYVMRWLNQIFSLEK